MRKISIILPTRNNEDHIGILLDSIFSQEIDVDLEVLMMDSSEDNTPNIAEEYSCEFPIKIMRVEPEDYNYGKTRNLGASLTNGDLIVFISTDIDIKDEKWLKKLMKNFDDPLVAGVFGRQTPKGNSPPMEVFFINYTYDEIRKEFYLGEKNTISNFFFSNTNSMIKRKMWEEIPLPEMLMSEDQEWAKRIILSGYKIVYEPEAIVYHSHTYSLGKVFKRYFDSGATLPFVYNDKRIKKTSMIKRGISYEIKQLKFLIKKEHYIVIPYSLIYDFSKFIGYLIGSKYKLIPNWLRKKLSYNPSHWDQYDDIISNRDTLIQHFTNP